LDSLSAELLVIIEHRKSNKPTKAESGSGATSQAPKAEQVVDPRIDLTGQKAVFKLNCLTLLGKELTKQSCS
jgi:hypothetical protein